MISKDFIRRFLTLVFAIPALALGGNFGLGIVAGSPSGISAKLKLSRTSALDGAVGWDTWGRGARIAVHGNYLFIFNAPFDIDFPNYFLYPGIGALLVVGSSREVVAARIPLGVGITAAERFEFFLELAPNLELIPSTDFDLDAGLGVRFYF